MSGTPAREWWIWTNLPQVASAATLCVFFIGILTWMVGGFTPKSQADLTDARERVAKLELALNSTNQTAASDKAATNAAIEAAKQLFYTELKAWPLPRELSAQASGFDSHMSKLDGRVDGLEHRIGEAEFGIRDLGNKYNSLTTTGARK